MKSLFMNALALTSIATAVSGCEVTGDYAIHVPDGGAVSCTTDADQISVVYQTAYVPNYLTVSINNDEFVFDECATDGSQTQQADFNVRRSINTEIQLGMSRGSSMRAEYFPYSDGMPYRSDISIRIMGRNNCYQSPTTLVPTTHLTIGWQPQSAGYGSCKEDGWIGAAVIN